MDRVLSELLEQQYVYWRKYESLDGLLVDGRKTAPNAAEFKGVCILISDQSLTPVEIGLRLSDVADRIASLTGLIGERGRGVGAMLRLPYSVGRNAVERTKRREVEHWTYRVELGAPG